MKQQLPEQINPQENKPPKVKRSRKTHSILVPVKQLINLLMVRRLSKEQIAEHLGLNLCTAQRYVRILHRKPGNLIHVCDWKRSATVGNYTAIFTWGPSEQDVPRPAPLPKSSKDYNRRKSLVLRTIKTETGVIHHGS